MSRIVCNNKDIWNGYELTERQKGYLTGITLLEFNKPLKDRMKPFKLIELTKNLIQ